MLAGKGYTSQATGWNRPNLQNVPLHTTNLELVTSQPNSFLTVEHRDSWSPSWNSSSSYSVPSGNYDFFLS
jgi:hypothetical protein